MEVPAEATAKLEPFTTSVPIVELGDLNSEEEATPVASIVKIETLDEVCTSSKFAGFEVLSTLNISSVEVLTTTNVFCGVLVPIPTLPFLRTVKILVVVAM